MSKKSFKATIGFDNLLGESNEIKKRVAKISDEIKYTILIEEELLDQVKALAFMQRAKIKDIFSEALSVYIREYENKNGHLTIPKK